MNNFIEIIEKIKEALKIKSDKELATKLNLKTSAFSERKRTNSIPHNEILELCITENLNIDEIYTGKKTSKNYKEELLEIIEKLENNQIEYLYHIAKAEEIKSK